MGKKEMSKEERAETEAMINKAKKIEDNGEKINPAKDKSPLEKAIDKLSVISADFGVVNNRFKQSQQETQQLQNQARSLYEELQLAQEEIKKLSSNGKNDS